ncbi:MAG: adenine nucleotide alpha hydrolase [Gammaproteobacteria bacterium]|nr:adenine nucleotide alpha hydrolase [Gammaproteobacteria bacterium]MDE2022926.1 adenine nucleotide alpha hydrolase [Gammaproteobacteria bacterium]MDE2139462.1 adenine nucleotide alpha hydrolase [Gammaproteobacteria bacterium]MDE2274614.1 adenine nucleotide alpha hydrolase [Gammaproteobacteria bacterium]
MSRLPLILSWSGGKDSALALHALQHDLRYRVAGLLTSVNEHYGRISMHGVREALLDVQTKSIGLPLYKVKLSEHPSNEEYERKMHTALEGFKSQGIRHVAYGDLFLEDIRQYRLDNMHKLDMECVFPLWHEPTDKLARQFIALGFKAVLCCVDEQQLAGEFAGREYDETLLHDLPASVDPCGEHGEFHTFVYAGPVFRQPIAFSRGGCVRRDGRFHFCDLIPTESFASKTPQKDFAPSAPPSPTRGEGG